MQLDHEKAFIKCAIRWALSSLLLLILLVGPGITMPFELAIVQFETCKTMDCRISDAEMTNQTVVLSIDKFGYYAVKRVRTLHQQKAYLLWLFSRLYYQDTSFYQRMKRRDARSDDPFITIVPDHCLCHHWEMGLGHKGPISEPDRVTSSGFEIVLVEGKHKMKALILNVRQ